MDRNGILAFVCFILIFAFDLTIADSQNLAAVASKHNSTSTQVSGANAPDPKPIKGDYSKQKLTKGAPSESNSSQSHPQWTNETNSAAPPPQNQATKDISELNRTNSPIPAVQNQTTDNKKSAQGSNNTNLAIPPANDTDNEKNSRISNGTDASSPASNGTIPKDANNTNSATPSSSPVENTDNAKKGSPVDKSDHAKKDSPVAKSDHVKKDSSVDKSDHVKKDSPVDKSDNLKSDSPEDKSGLLKNDGGVQEKNNDDKSRESVVNETCLRTPKRCNDDKSLIACSQNLDTESRDLTILVQNEGEQTLRVKFIGSAGIGMLPNELEIAKHKTEKVNIVRNVDKSLKLILDAGNGECVLHLQAFEPEENMFFRFPSYDKIVTPINGAYLLIFTVVVLGVAWACCMFRRRRRHDGVPYQELEMGLPENASAANVETAEGWDQGWDDNWDDEAAVKSPGAPRVGSISANGLTARSSNRDGWENGWDD